MIVKSFRYIVYTKELSQTIVSAIIIVICGVGSFGRLLMFRLKRILQFSLKPYSTQHKNDNTNNNDNGIE